MTDQKPERFAAGERATLLAILQYQRESLVRKVADLDDRAARRQLVPSGTTLLFASSSTVGPADDGSPSPIRHGVTVVPLTCTCPVWVTGRNAD